MVLGLVRGLGLATTNVRRRQAYGRDAAEGLAETAVLAQAFANEPERFTIWLAPPD